MVDEPMRDQEYARARAYLERFTGPHAPRMTAEDLALAQRTNAEGERRRRERDAREQHERPELQARRLAAHRCPGYLRDPTGIFALLIRHT